MQLSVTTLVLIWLLEQFEIETPDIDYLDK